MRNEKFSVFVLLLALPCFFAFGLSIALHQDLSYSGTGMDDDHSPLAGTAKAEQADRALIIENPEKPINEKAGRAVLLREEIRIKDEQGGFYFKNPDRIKVAPDGHVFCLDDDQFLEFSADGQFLKNHFRKGQGPGEFQRIENYLFAGDEIVVHQRSPNKIVVLDRQGNLIRDSRPEETVAKLLSSFQNRYLMAQHSFPQVEKVKKEEGEVLDIDWNLCFVSTAGKVEKIDSLYRTQWFAKRLPTAVIADNITELLAAPLAGKYIILSHTRDYRLKVFDLEKKEIVRTFRRKYKSVRCDAERKDEAKSRFRRLAIPRDYHNDVQKIFAGDSQVYVFTSTVEKKKGFLVDVFDAEGRYVDNFYLPLQEKIGLHDLGRYPLTLDGHFLWMVERDEQDVPSLVKYRILT